MKRPQATRRRRRTCPLLPPGTCRRSATGARRPVSTWATRSARKRLCLVLPLPFVAKTAPLPCASTAFVTKTLPLTCACTALAAKTAPSLRSSGSGGNTPETYYDKCADVSKLYDELLAHVPRGAAIFVISAYHNPW